MLEITTHIHDNHKIYKNWWQSSHLSSSKFWEAKEAYSIQIFQKFKKEAYLLNRSQIV